MTLDRTDDGNASEEKFEEVRIRDEIDEKLGFWRWEGGHGALGGGKDERVGWLVNMHAVSCSSSLFTLTTGHWRYGVGAI